VHTTFQHFIFVTFSGGLSTNLKKRENAVYRCLKTRTLTMWFYLQKQQEPTGVSTDGGQAPFNSGSGRRCYIAMSQWVQCWWEILLAYSAWLWDTKSGNSELDRQSRGPGSSVTDPWLMWRFLKSE